jgi:hypothetical protein
VNGYQTIVLSRRSTGVHQHASTGVDRRRRCANDSGAVLKHEQGLRATGGTERQRGGRYANRICRIVVLNGALGPDTPVPNE